MKNSRVIRNKPCYLGLSNLDISKKVMHEYWYYYEKSKYGDSVKLCYRDTDNFKVHVKSEDVYVDITKDVETRFDTSYYEFNRPLITERLIKWKKNEKVCHIEINNA